MLLKRGNSYYVVLSEFTITRVVTISRSLSYRIANVADKLVCKENMSSRVVTVAAVTAAGGLLAYCLFFRKKKVSWIKLVWYHHFRTFFNPAHAKYCPPFECMSVCPSRVRCRNYSTILLFYHVYDARRVFVLAFNIYWSEHCILYRCSYKKKNIFWMQIIQADRPNHPGMIL